MRKLFSWFSEISKKLSRYEDLELMNEGLQKSLRRYSEEIDNLREEITALHRQNKGLRIAKEHVEKALTDCYKGRTPLVEDADYWNDKWPRNTIWYRAPTRKKLTSYLKRDTHEEITRVGEVLASGFKNPDSLVSAAQSWLAEQFRLKNFEYVSEKRENWKSASQTLDDEKGDCDDWGIVLYNIIREAFLKQDIWDEVKHRLKCVNININRILGIPSNVGAHFNLLWLHSDGQWYTVETTYFLERAIKHFGNLPAKYDQAYGTLWYAFNEDHSWSQNSFTVSRNDLSMKYKVPYNLKNFKDND